MLSGPRLGPTAGQIGCGLRVLRHRRGHQRLDRTLAQVSATIVRHKSLWFGLPHSRLTKDPRDAARLETLSLGLAHACRSFLKRLWVPELGGVENIRPPAK